MLCINCYQWIFVSIMFNNTDRLFNLKSMVRRALGFTVLRYFGNFMHRSNRSFNMPPPPPGIPRAFDTFAVPGRREFDDQSLLGGGEFDPHALGVGNLNCTLDFM